MNINGITRDYGFLDLAAQKTRSGQGKGFADLLESARQTAGVSAVPQRGESGDLIEEIRRQDETAARWVTDLMEKDPARFRAWVEQELWLMEESGLDHGILPEGFTAEDARRLVDEHGNILGKLKAGEDVSQEEWLDFLGTLKDMGAITQEEYNVSRGDGMLIPIGYLDENGKLVMYENVAEAAGLVDKLGAMQAGFYRGESWTGDPLAWLDLWLQRFQSWRDDLAASPKKYKDLSPIDDRVAALTRVSELVRGLIT